MHRADAHRDRVPPRARLARTTHGRDAVRRISREEAHVRRRASPEDRARGKDAAKEWVDTTAKGYDGHVVAVVDDGTEAFIVDSTLAQATRPDRGLVIPACIMKVGPCPRRAEPGCQLEASFLLDDDTDLKVTYVFKETRDFESAPGWEPSHLWPIIHRIVREMRWAQTIERRASEFKSQEDFTKIWLQ